MAEHGLSIYIESQGKKILFDTGASDLFLKNGENINVDISQVDEVVISHGHYDHTQGVPCFCRENKNAPIYIHKEAFHESYSINHSKTEMKPSGIRWTKSEVEEIRPRLVLTDGVTYLTDNIVISGTIPDLKDEIIPKQFYRKIGDGEYIKDPMDHEQILVIKEEGGIYIFSGCSHKGIIPAIAYAREIFPGEPIVGLVAGMHLYNASDEMRKSVVDKVVLEDMDFVMPVHCTGIEAICDLKARLKDKCIVATAGDSYGY